MSAMIVPKEALNHWLNAQLDNSVTLTDCVLRLFQANVPVDLDTTLAELMAQQSTYPGYSQQAIEGWTPSVVIADKATTIPDDITFEATAADAQKIYGCFATNSAGSKLWFALNFGGTADTPFGHELVISTKLFFSSFNTE